MASHVYTRGPQNGAGGDSIHRSESVPGTVREHEVDRTHPVVHDTTGLSRGYRFRWRLKYLGLHVFSTASRQPGINPREQMRVERAQKVAAAHRARGDEPSAEIRHAIGEDD